jgi:hypothetical protein
MFLVYSHILKNFLFVGFSLSIFLYNTHVFASTSIPFTINLSEAVNVTGTPRIAVDVGGVARYATYASGTGTSALTFTYAMVVGDVDLDGVTVSSPIDLNGGTIKDLSGNDLSPLTFTPPNTSNVKVNYPSLGIDFIYDADGRYTLNGTAYNDLPSFLSAAGGTFSRSTTGTYFDSVGTLQTAATNAPRFDYDPITYSAKGLLIEKASTNYIKNSQFSGISSATYTATQNFTNWQISIPGTGLSGKSVTFTPGTANGIPYLDIRMQATNTQGSPNYITFNPFLADSMAVSNGIQTIASGWFGITSYSSTGGTCAANFENRSMTSAGGYVSSVVVSLSGTSPYQKRTTAVLTHGATAAYASEWVYLVLPVGATCDITMRYGAPQIEQSAVATSYIPTPINATAVRGADVLTVPTGAWYNVNAGTMFGNVSWQSSTGSGYPMMMRFDDGTSNNRWNFFFNQSAGKIGYDGYTASVGQGSQSFGAVVTSGDAKMGAAQALNNTNAAYAGTLGTLDTTWNPPPATILDLRVLDTGVSASKWMKQFKYYPLRITDTQLQLMTQ